MLSLAWSATSWNCRLKSQTSSENCFLFSTSEYSVDISLHGLGLSSHIVVHHILCDYGSLLHFDLLTQRFLSDTWYRFQLKQEQENRRNANMMYNTTRDKLRRTEEQHQLEVQERQKVELTLRNLELEMRTLVNSMKQVHPLKLH